MTLKLKIEYLSIVRERYYRSSKSEKTKILNELCAVTGYSRKYALRILAIKHLERPKRSGKAKAYSDTAAYHLKHLWRLMGQMCSKKMVQALPIWIEHYEAKGFSLEIKQEVLSMSHATIDRYLKHYKAIMDRRSRSGTKPGKYLKRVIPIKDFDQQLKDRPGFVEADTVAHCGDSLSGKFIWTLTFTDVYSGWTNNRAIYTKDSDAVISAILHINARLPYDLLAFNTDNGSEFLNRNLILHFSNNEELKKAVFTRSRPYKKNDNCHVEQKNWTHVRGLFGYDRFDHEELVKIMNDIYMNYHNVLNNFFVPQLKLKEKIRVGAKYVRKYDPAKTPYQRLLESAHLKVGQKEELRRKYESLNPVILKQELNKMMREFKKLRYELSLESLDQAA